MSAPSAPPERTVTSARTGDLAVFAASGYAFASWISRVPDVKEVLALTHQWPRCQPAP